MTDLPYLKRDKNQHGSPRVFVRRNGRTVRLREAEGSAAFLKEYAAALDKVTQEPRPAAPVIAKPERGTLGWLATAYFASIEFKALNPQSQRTRRNVIESCLAEIHKGEPMRDCPLDKIDAAKLKTLRDAKADKPAAANNRLKRLSTMFAWAVEAGILKTNPARDVRRMTYATDGFHAWSVEEVRQFESRWPVGTKARLALALLLFLGVRRGDVVTLGRQHVRNGVISFVPRKTRHRRKVLSHKPILSELQRVLDGSPKGALTFLETELGRPFTAAGFGNAFRAWCDQANLPNCSAHGLRKMGAVLAAENGATTNELMSVFDWTNPAQAEIYTRSADRARLAAKAMTLITRRRDEQN